MSIRAANAAYNLQADPGLLDLGRFEQTDQYTFTLAAPQQLFLDALGDCGGTYIRWSLLGADGTLVKADDGTPDSALCFDLGTYTLQAGRYTVKVQAIDVPGTYSFVVRTP